MTMTQSNSGTSTTVSAAYAIGEPGKKWGMAEKKQWRDTRVKQRSYFEDVLPRIEALRDNPAFVVSQYGDLVVHDSINNEASNNDESCSSSSSSSGTTTTTGTSTSFPLFAIRSSQWQNDKPCVLITGGVHGYETSGIMGALLFLETSCQSSSYSHHFNMVVLPCVSPWGYEHVQRWNAHAVDPNRSFNPDGEIVEGRSFNPEKATDESAALIRFLKQDMAHLMKTEGSDSDNDSNNYGWMCHLDLHETTDTDETEFRPAKEARDGLPPGSKGEIPDGFYLVQDETSMKPHWFTAMIDKVRQVMHIAPTDKDGLIIGEKVSQEGVIAIPSNKALGLCAGVTDAPYRATTEVYPDSDNATPEQCNLAQVACIEGALDYILKEEYGISVKMDMEKEEESASGVNAVENGFVVAAKQ